MIPFGGKGLFRKRDRPGKQFLTRSVSLTVKLFAFHVCLGKKLQRILLPYYFPLRGEEESENFFKDLILLLNLLL